MASENADKTAAGAFPGALKVGDLVQVIGRESEGLYSIIEVDFYGYSLGTTMSSCYRTEGGWLDHDKVRLVAPPASLRSDHPGSFIPMPKVGPIPMPPGAARSTPAGDILREAAVAVDGDRNATHGDKERSFEAIAAMWSAYLANRKDPKGPIRPHDVAHMMVLQKQQRAEWGSPVRDQFVDAAGYSAVAGELAGK